MDKAERSKLLRVRFRAIGGIPLPLAVNGHPKPAQVPKRWFYHSATFNIGQHVKEVRAPWVYRPDPKPDHPKPKAGFRHDAHPLEKIAAKWRSNPTQRFT